MEERWPTCHRPACRWLDRVDRAITRLELPAHGTFMSITNALDFQVEQGADPDTLRHLLQALVAFTKACDVDLDVLGLREDVDGLMASFAPKRRRRRKKTGRSRTGGA